MFFTCTLKFTCLGFESDILLACVSNFVCSIKLSCFVRTLLNNRLFRNFLCFEHALRSCLGTSTSFLQHGKLLIEITVE